MNEGRPIKEIYAEQRERTLKLADRLQNLGLRQPDEDADDDSHDFQIDTDSDFWTIAMTQEGIEKLIYMADSFSQAPVLPAGSGSGDQALS